MPPKYTLTATKTTARSGGASKPCGECVWWKGRGGVRGTVGEGIGDTRGVGCASHSPDRVERLQKGHRPSQHAAPRHPHVPFLSLLQPSAGRLGWAWAHDGRRQACPAIIPLDSPGFSSSGLSSQGMTKPTARAWPKDGRRRKAPDEACSVWRGGVDVHVLYG